MKNTLLYCSSENMKSIPDDSIHLMVTSPPYNVSKEYDEDLKLAHSLISNEIFTKHIAKQNKENGKAFFE